MLLFFSWCFKPAEILNLQAYKASPQEVAKVNELRDASYNKEQPPQFFVEVDYSAGANAAWYPKGESPVLKELVQEGKLPPVAERVGPEPLVLRSQDGFGQYGGTMYRLNDGMGIRFSPITLVRWSTHGHPIVPNVAKSYTISADHMTYTFKLRKGTRWSDGEPFTSKDISFFWNDIILCKELNPNGAFGVFRPRGKPMKLETPDLETVIFKFDEPYPLFIEVLAGFEGYLMMRTPAHFLRKFHPVFGDKDLIRKVMKEHNLVNEFSVFSFVRLRVEMPTLTPWMMHTEKMTPPEVYVRNPYYFAVDENGNQLPYLDRVVVSKVSDKMLAIAATQGEVNFQDSSLRFDDYTLMMNQRSKYNYEVYHWVAGDGANWGISLNLNRSVAPNNLAQKHKAELLKNKKFRQALSVGIHRKMIIKATLSGMAEPMQCSPNPLSADYDPAIAQKYAQFDPALANQLLDECGLTDRDSDGYRKFKNGPALLFDLNFCSFTGEGPAQFILDDWRKVGVHVKLRQLDRTLFFAEKSTGEQDMTVWNGYGSFNLYSDNDLRYYLPTSQESNFAPEFAAWYGNDGLIKNLNEPVRGKRPDENDPLMIGLRLLDTLKITNSPETKKMLMRQIVELAAENCYHLNIHSPMPQLAIVRNGFLNVPKKGVYSWGFLSPGNFAPELWCLDHSDEKASTLQSIKDDISNITPHKPLVGNATMDSQGVMTEVPVAYNLSLVLKSLFNWGILLASILLVVLLVMKHPFAGKRILIMIPTLWIISVVSFVVIELPPGDAVTTKIVEMVKSGQVDERLIQETKELFRVDEPAWKRYLWWTGLEWFVTFDQKDEGLLQGNMGRSMLDFKPVNSLVSDKIMFTVVISLGTILLTWMLALPIGVYSAVKQYSFFDYLFTVGGFMGMCIPGFLLALLFMFGAEKLFGLSVSGLFSPEYAAEKGWSMGKVLDLLKHLWLPILIEGISGTAGMIRVMRANLLDELKKPYVTTARAKGVRPLKLLLKYPVRIALNPFISGIGGIFPHMISGGAIVAIVMSLPTVGPMQLDAVMKQDMYLAGSMLMVLSLMSVIGTLVSDLLLILLDPRIRLKAGGK